MIIKDIWFDGEWIYGRSDEGKTYRQSLLWYKALMNASSEERSKYVFSGEGIHWRHLDTDISFESFEYPEAEPSPIQRFFLTHPEINIAGFAEKAGINASLLRNYINGFKNPSPDTAAKILNCVHSIGKEYLEAMF